MDRNNLIIIVLDTVRSGNMSCYGYEKQTTPFLDELCASSIMYKNAFSPAIWTIPSHASLFTGTYLAKHGAVNLYRHLDDKLITLSEVFSSNNYNTVSFSNNYFISVKEFGLSRGFTVSEGKVNPKKFFSRAAHKGKQILTNSVDCGALATNMFVKDFLKNQSNKPFFLFLNYMEAHAPYKNIPKFFLKLFLDNKSQKRIQSVNQDRQKFLTRSIKMTEEEFKLLRAIYDSQIAYLDYRIKELFTILKQSNSFDNSIIIITSDHGDMIGEHDLMHHSYCIYDELIKIPLIFRFPDNQNNGKIIEDMVSLIDIPATIIKLLGIHDDSFSAQQQGKVLPFANNLSEQKYIYSECEKPKNEFKETYPNFEFSIYDKQHLAIRSKDYKLIWSSDQNLELFHITNDAGENKNLIDKEPELAQEMKNNLMNWYNNFDSEAPKDKKLNLDTDVENQLKALGYF